MATIDIPASSAVERLRQIVRFHANSADMVFTTSDVMGTGGIAITAELTEAILQAAATAGAVGCIEPGVWEAQTDEVLDIHFTGVVNAIIVRHAGTPKIVQSTARACGLLTEEEAAAQAGVSQKTIRRSIESGRLQAIDYGTGSKHLYRIEPAALAVLEPTATPEVATPPKPPRRQRSTRQAASSAAAYLPRVSSASAKVAGRS